MYNLGIHFGTTFVFDRIDYDARQQLSLAHCIVNEYLHECATLIHITGNQMLVQQLAKDFADIPCTTGKLPNPKITDTHVIPNNH